MLILEIFKIFLHSILSSSRVANGAVPGVEGVEGVEEKGVQRQQDSPWEEAEQEAMGSRPPYNLFCVMAAFDGARPLSQAVKLLPEPLQEHSLDIVVWLLRRKILFVQDPRHKKSDKSLLEKLKAKYPL